MSIQRSVHHFSVERFSANGASVNICWSSTLGCSNSCNSCDTGHPHGWCDGESIRSSQFNCIPRRKDFRGDDRALHTVHSVRTVVA
jgi:hypothetical protein